MINTEKRLKRKIDALLEQGLDEKVYPGAVLLIGRQSNILYFQAFGKACLQPGEEVMRNDTVFDLASLTKVLATVPALMHLLSEKRLSLDDPVCQYLPECLSDNHDNARIGHSGESRNPAFKTLWNTSGFPRIKYGAGLVKPGMTVVGQTPDFCLKEALPKAATIRHLLTHSSGLDSWFPFYKDILVKQIPFGRPAQEYVIDKIYHLPPVYTPGEKSLYSDLDYILLGRVVEGIAGLSLGKFCTDKIFIPLEMDGTFFGGQIELETKELPIAATEFSDWRGGILQGKVHDENAYVMGGSAGHAGLFSTAANIFIFCRNILCSLKSDKGFWPKQMMAQFVSRQDLPQGSSWALGWDTPSPVGSTSGRFFSPYSIGHTGFTGTSVWIDLRAELTVIFLTNRIHPARSNARIRAFRPILHNTIRETLAQ